MGRKTNTHKIKNTNNWLKNIFSMEGGFTSYYKEKVIISFEPVKDISRMIDAHGPQWKKAKEDIVTREISIIPKFNNDQRFYTSTFINPYEEEIDDTEALNNHLFKISESKKTIDASEILIPKPKSRNQYCAVCRAIYQDYLVHIKLPGHKQKISISEFNDDIIQLTHKLNNQSQKPKGSRKFILPAIIDIEKWQEECQKMMDILRSKQDEKNKSEKTSTMQPLEKSSQSRRIRKLKETSNNSFLSKSNKMITRSDLRVLKI